MYLGQTRGLNKGSGAVEQVSAGEVSPLWQEGASQTGGALGVSAFLEVVM